MKKYLIAIALLIPSIASAQYVAQAIQARIDSDNAGIQADQADITAKQADIDAIVNDTQANDVTSQVPDVQTIEAQQTQNNLSGKTQVPVTTNSGS